MGRDWDLGRAEKLSKDPMEGSFLKRMKQDLSGKVYTLAGRQITSGAAWRESPSSHGLGQRKLEGGEKRQR